MSALTLPSDLPAKIVEAIGDARVSAVRERGRGLVTYDLVVRDGWPLRVLKVAPAGDPFVALAEVDRLDWIDRRLPCPKLLASSPLSSGGHAVVLSLPAGTPALMPEHRVHPTRTVEYLAQALRFVHEVPIDACPFNMRVELRMRSIRRRVNAGHYDTRTFNEPYNRYSSHRLLEILGEIETAEDDLVFTHGSFGTDVALLDLTGVSGIVDWGRAGVADRYVDLAHAVRSVAATIGPELIPHFFQCYGLEHPNPRKLDFFALLAEFE
ncbi:MAG TPA: aminoglycoside 3'-phosphotransferase [Acidimicrobiales bacterium]|nr:aminoglycoside 3'-phosphotransferase [Acidimicrobiales bacterium]